MVARDNPFFAAQIDSELYGDENVLGKLPPLEARLRILASYAGGRAPPCKIRHVQAVCILPGGVSVYTRPSL